MVGRGREGVVDEIELQAESFGLVTDLLYTLSVIEVQSKHLATLEEGLDATWPAPLGAFIEHERTPGLPSGDETSEGFRIYLLDLRSEPGANNADFGPGVTELIHLVLVLELGGGLMVPLFVVEGD